MCAFQGVFIIGCGMNRSKSIAVIDFPVSNLRLTQWVALLAHKSSIIGSVLCLGFTCFTYVLWVSPSFQWIGYA